MAELDPAQLRRARLRLQGWALVAAHAGGPLAGAALPPDASLPPGHLGTVLATSIPFGAIAMVLLLQSLREAMLPVLRLEKGAAGRQARVDAARAVLRAPRRLRWATARSFTFSVGSCLIGWSLLIPGFGAAHALRIGLVTGCALAIGMFFSELATRTTGRRILRLLTAHGLGAEDAAPLQKEFSGSVRATLIELVTLFAVVGSVLVSQAAFFGADGHPGLAGWLSLLITFALACVAAIVVAHGLSRPLREFSGRAQRITAGRLERGALIAGDREVFVIAVAGARIEQQLEDAVRKLAVASERLSGTTAGLVGTLGGQEQGSAEQASALNETSATTEELARSAAQIAENAGEVAEVAERTVQAAQRGQRGSEAFFNAMIGMRTQNQRVADAVVRLNKRVQQIGKIVEFIHEIADKSDLLALNAELEGTKAGEVGRGFSLVAAEMRRVAEEVLRSTRAIERLITDIRDATNAAVMATEAGVKATDGGTSAANEVMERLRVILEHARETSDAVRSISMATHQQQSGSAQLAEAMADILRVTEEGAVATQQLHGANVDLSGLADSLRAVVSRFEVKGADAS